MNTNEIVSALRTSIKIIGDTGDNTVLKILKRHISNAANLIESLKAQLTESQRRERAAVEDLKLSAVELSEGMGTCVVCKHFPENLKGNNEMCDECAVGECLFEWRGPVAEEGAKP